MVVGQVIIGIIFILIGIPLMLIPFFGWIYGPILIGLGIVLIILRHEEDKIEQRKDIKTKKSKK